MLSCSHGTKVIFTTWLVTLVSLSAPMRAGAAPHAETPYEKVVRCVDRATWNGKKCTLESVVVADACSKLFGELSKWVELEKAEYMRQMGVDDAKRLLSLPKKYPNGGRGVPLTSEVMADQFFLIEMYSRHGVLVDNLNDANILEQLLEMTLNFQSFDDAAALVFREVIASASLFSASTGLNYAIKHVFAYTPSTRLSFGSFSLFTDGFPQGAPYCAGEENAYAAQAELFYLKVLEFIKANQPLCGGVLH